MTVPPIISGLGKATNFKFGRYVQRVHTNKSRLKILEKLERGRIQGLPKFFEYPVLSQERIKLRTSNFVCTFLVSIGTKVLYKFREKQPGAFARTFETFQGTHILGASRGRLCDSKAFLYRHGGAAVRRRTRDRKVTCSTSGRGDLQVNSAFHPSGVGKSSTILHGWRYAGRVHLCRVAGSTV